MVSEEVNVGESLASDVVQRVGLVPACLKRSAKQLSAFCSTRRWGRKMTDQRGTKKERRNKTWNVSSSSTSHFPSRPPEPFPSRL